MNYFRSKQFYEMKIFYSKCTFSLPPENIRKPYGFFYVFKGRERVHWEQMG